MSAATGVVSGWPDTVFEAPLWRGLDAAARATVARAGRLRDVEGALYQDGDPGEALFVVVAGAVELHATRRGDTAATRLRTARAGDSFGEEALFAGLARCASARAAAGTRVAELPAAVARRILARRTDASHGDASDPAVARHGATGAARRGEEPESRELRYLVRAAARDLLASSALGRDLDGAELELLLDGVALERFGRGAELIHAGDRAEHIYVVAEGLLQVQRGEAVQAYLARGDFFGDEAAFAGRPSAATVVAAGETWCAVLPRAVVRTVADRNHGLLARWRRVADAHAGDQAALLDGSAAGSTQHAFRDLYRLQVARSLLVIDQDTCVRCGHCAWSCGEVHGESRLVRRGDKVVTPVDRALDQLPAARPATLLLPNTCQHCRHAACLQDCPTGAIGRDLDGEVFIRADACTGCANCARSCPWDNISMSPRRSLPVLGARPAGSTTRLALSADVAVKCDLCRDHAEPACVIACPTGSLLRIDPGRAFVEVAQILGLRPASSAPTPPTPARPAASTSEPPSGSGSVAAAAVTGMRSMATAAAIAMAGAAVVAAAAMAGARGWTPGRGGGLVAGVVAAMLVIALCAYALPKRLVRMRMKPRDRRERERPPARSRTRGYMVMHVGLGAAAPAIVVAHAGFATPASPGGALLMAFAIASVLGGAGAIVYRALPRALTRLERTGALPEDLDASAGELRARLFREISGTSELVKRIAARVLVPYARAPLGWIALAASGRGLSAEERALRARVDRMLDGRGADRLAGLDHIIRLAVEVRALAGRRALTAALRAWLPLHIVAAAVTLALLVLHVVMVTR